MIVSVWRRLISPRSSDPTERRREGLLNVLALSGLGASLLFTVISAIAMIWIGPHRRLIGDIVVGAEGIAMAVSAYLFGRSGRVKTGVFVALFSLMIMQLTSMIVIWQVPLDPTMVFYALVITLGGLLLGRKWAVVFYFLSLGIYAAGAFFLYWTGHTQAIIAHVGTVPIIIAMLAVGLGVLLLVVHFYIRSIEEALIAAEDLVRSRTHELREAYRDLAEQHTKLDIILRNVADGLVVTDLDDRIVMVNPTFAQMVSKPTKDLIGAKIGQVFPDTTLAQAIAVVKERTAIVSTVDAKRSNRIYRASACALGGEEDYPISGVVTVLRDITQEVEIARMKDDFVSMVSHELRTPLTSVLGFARLIHKQFLRHIQPELARDNNQVQHIAQRILGNLEIITSEGERLTRLINDVLDIAKMEAGRIQWELGRIDLTHVIEKSVEATQSLAQEKGLAIETEISTGLPFLHGDHDRLIQVVTNLLSNAIKFTDEGYVHVRAWFLKPGDDIVPYGNRQSDSDIRLPVTKPFVAVSVTDTGIGIPQQDMSRMFERFRQLGDRTSGTRRQGTGLGLAICQEILIHHGGHIWVESRPGNGSRFIFTLPLGRLGD
jgi:signal transduction histidine kinase